MSAKFLLNKLSTAMMDAFDGYGNQEDTIDEYQDQIESLFTAFRQQGLPLRFFMEFTPESQWKWYFVLSKKGEIDQSVAEIKTILRDVFESFFSEEEIDSDADEILYSRLAKNINEIDLGFKFKKTRQRGEIDDDDEEWYTYRIQDVTRSTSLDRSNATDSDNNRKRKKESKKTESDGSDCQKRKREKGPTRMEIDTPKEKKDSPKHSDDDMRAEQEEKHKKSISDVKLARRNQL